jgi:hypothetical protein
LLVILLRGRKAKQAELAAPQFEEPYTPEPGVSPGVGAAAPLRPAAGADVTGPQRPMAAGPVEGKTVGWGEAAPGGWTEAAPGGWPAAHVPEAPRGGPPMGPGAAPVEGTRVIERAPKHLAMLVSKLRPDQKYDLKGTMNVGRALDNQIVIDHPTISRRHAWIKEDKGEFLVFDIGSANGTFVNGQQIEAPQLLQTGDLVRFGEVEFVFTKVF